MYRTERLNQRRAPVDKIQERMGSLKVEKSPEVQPNNRQKICWNCHSSELLLKCSGCMRARYCDQECQEEDWGRHRDWCVSKQRRRRVKQSDSLAYFEFWKTQNESGQIAE